MRRGWLWILAIALFSCGSVYAKGKVYLISAVFWEGEPLEAENWKALATFRSQFPEVPLVHFFTPVYFTRPGGTSLELAEKWQKMLQQFPMDTPGIQLSGWKSLVEGAGVSFLSEPTFWGAPLRCNPDCGHEVPISAYKEADGKKLLQYSVDVLKNHGITPKAFLAGGHMSTEALTQSLPEFGIYSDFSAIDPQVLASAFHPYPWYQMVHNRWGSVSLLSQPKKISTSNGAVTQFYQTLGPIDDLSIASFQQRYKDLALSDKEGPKILFWGFHFETIGKNLNKVLEAMAFVRKFHQETGLSWKSFQALLEDAAAFPY